MKKLFVIVGVFFISIPLVSAEGRYVLPASVDRKGTLEGYSYVKSYAIEQVEGEKFSQVDMALKYGIRWVPIRNFELYLEPPLIRYHNGDGPIACAGLGDMDIGAKVLFTKGVGGHAFARVATGAYDLPMWDNWAPPFSNESQATGGGAKLLFSQELIKGLDVHLNLGYLYRIGDLDTKESPIPENRTPLGIGITLPYGIFIEGETDINTYNDSISITENPLRIAAGINHEWLPGIKFLIAFEYGTWGTGDPPIHRWNYGWGEDITQWDITLGISAPLTFPGKAVVVTGAVEGRITDRITGEPIKAKIVFPKAKVTTITSETGEYRITLPPGKYTLVIDITGYETYTTAIEIQPGDVTKADFRLTPGN